MLILSAKAEINLDQRRMNMNTDKIFAESIANDTHRKTPPK